MVSKNPQKIGDDVVSPIVSVCSIPCAITLTCFLQFDVWSQSVVQGLNAPVRLAANEDIADSQRAVLNDHLGHDVREPRLTDAALHTFASPVFATSLNPQHVPASCHEP